MQAAILHVILCRCGAPMKQEFLAASKQGREATCMLWCENQWCTSGGRKKRFKLVLPTVYLEEVPYAPRDEADSMTTLNRLTKGPS